MKQFHDITITEWLKGVGIIGISVRGKGRGGGKNRADNQVL